MPSSGGSHSQAARKATSSPMLARSVPLLNEFVRVEVANRRFFLDDALLHDYLQTLWRPLVQAARARGDIGADTERLFPYELFLVRDRAVNAFALPGGYVGVHLGLIALTATPDELASVLAHELSHCILAAACRF